MAQGRAPDQLVTAGTFIAFVAAGTLFIAVAKTSQLAAVVVTAVPVGIMVCYAAVVSLVKGVRLRDDQTGDNIYYMGFLFTLVSLGVSLYQFSPENGATEIVRNFGIAIGSTIAGVALRVFFNQMRRDPVEVERAARLELAEAARRVRQELDGTVIELGHFRRSAQQAIAEGFDEMRRQVESHAASLLTSLETVTAKATGPLDATATAVAAAVEQVSKTASAFMEAGSSIGAETETIAKSLKKVASTLSKADEKLQALSNPEALINVRLEPLSETFTATVDELRGVIASHAVMMQRLSNELASKRRWRWVPWPHRRRDRDPVPSEK